MGVEAFLAVGDVTSRINCIIRITISICQVKSRNTPSTVGKGVTSPTIHGTILTSPSILILKPILSTLRNTIRSQYSTHKLTIQIIPIDTSYTLVFINTVETKLFTVNTSVI